MEQTKEWFKQVHLLIGSLVLPSGTNKRQFGGTTVWTINDTTA